MLWPVLSLSLISFVLGLPMTWAAIRLAHRVGQIDKPDDPASGGRKWHKAPTPSTGGIAIFWATILPIAAGLTLVWIVPQQAWADSFPAVAKHLAGLKAQTPGALGLIGALLVVHLLGLVDDRLRLGPILKLGVQLAVAAALVVFFDHRVLTFLSKLGPAGTLASVGVSVLWIVAITNAMNFMDNMDGLSGGVGAIVAGVYLAANLLGGQWFVAALCAVLLGALVAFLVFNFHPARVFMGDGGSLVLGLLLAVISIRTTYFGVPSPEAVDRASHWWGVLMPVVVLAVPLYDLVSVSLIRIAQGKSPLVGDRQHFSHRLVNKGLSQPAAVVVIWMCTLATALGGVMLRNLEAWQACLVAAQTAAMVAVLALLERTRKGESK